MRFLQKVQADLAENTGFMIDKSLEQIVGHEEFEMMQKHPNTCGYSIDTIPGHLAKNIYKRLDVGWGDTLYLVKKGEDNIGAIISHKLKFEGSRVSAQVSFTKNMPK